MTVASEVRTMLIRLGWQDVEAWTAALVGPMTDNGITTPARMAAFVATGHVETGAGRTLVENLNYSTTGLRATFSAARISDADCKRYGRSGSSPANQEMIATLLYGGAWGLKNLGNTLVTDGWYFRGRGFIQVTGRANYTRLAKATATAITQLPILLETKAGAASLSAHWWSLSGINEIADTRDATAIRRAVNGGSNGLEEFRLACMRASGLGDWYTPRPAKG